MSATKEKSAIARHSAKDHEVDERIMAASKALKQVYFVNGKPSSSNSRKTTNFFIFLLVLVIGYLHYLLFSNVFENLDSPKYVNNKILFILPILILFSFILLIYLFNSEKFKQIKALKLIRHSESLLNKPQ